MIGMEYAWLIPVLSFVAFPLILLLGKFLPGKGSSISIGAIGAGFILFLFVMVDRLSNGATEQAFFKIDWFTVGSVELTWGFIIDPLSVSILGLVTFVALMVQIYSLSYMKDDPRFNWYFGVQAFFAGSMLTLVLADNFLLLYIAWELVGLCSYLLIGFWYERKPAVEAAKKAFITTRLADVALLVGILLLYKQVGSFSMSETFEQAELLMAGANSALSSGTTLIAALLLFVGAMGKSAQVPLHVWLPDAMEGPTPVSALIHAATMVAAGIFLVARTFVIFEAAPDSLLIVAIVGLLTTLMAASMALVMTDLKQILAYSTISHLGLMMLSLGSFGYTAAIFHLMTHGFSKALLFLAAGSVMHGIGRTDIRQMGGLIKVMPLTALAFGIGAVSLGGIPIFAGFWSKDEILLSVLDHRHPIFMILVLVAVFMSALYMARAFFVAFMGEISDENRKGHEAPVFMAIPMILLAILAVTSGLLALEWTDSFRGIGSFIFAHEGHGFEFNLMLGLGSTILATSAFIIAWLIYVKGSISISPFKRTFAPIISIAERKYYLDSAYQGFIDRVVLVFSSLVAKFDRVFVNDVAVNGVAESVKRSAFTLRHHVTGLMYNYAFVMVVGAIVLVAAWWAIAVKG